MTVPPPKPRRLIARERLFKRIDEARTGRALWVTAEAGSGKTSLLASYVESRRLPVIWYRVSAADKDLPTFFHYFGEAVRRGRPRVPQPLPHLTPEYLPSVEAFAKRYFERAFAGLRGPAMIVLDELQGPALSSPLVDIVVSAAEDLPQSAFLTVLSRNSPPPPFARLLAGSSLSLIGSEDMRFSEHEARELAELLGCADSAAVKRCLENARGWAAGLALLLRHQSTRNVPGESATQRLLFDYFAAEFFEREPKESQDVLLKTALVPDVTGPQVAALCGNARAPDVLARLARDNAFVYQAAETTFEYHPLLREFLVARAETGLPGDELERVRRTSARLLEEATRDEAAAEIWLRCRAWKELSDLVVRSAPRLISQGRWRPVNEWIAAMPPEIVQEASQLLYWKGMSEIPLSAPAARRSLSRAHELAAAASDRDGALLACCGVLEAYGTEVADFRGAAAWVECLAGLLPELPDEIPAHIEMRLALAFEAVKWSRPQHPLMRRWIERARQRALGPVPPALVMAYAYAATYFESWLGEHQRCAALLPLGRAAWGAADVPPVLKAAWCAVELTCYCFTADFAAARAVAQRIGEIADQFGLYLAAGMLDSARAYIGICTGDTDAANEAIERAVAQVDISRRVQACHCYYLRSQLSLARGKLDDALRYARTYLRWLETVSAPFPVAVGKLAASQVLIEHGLYAEAQALTDEARQFAREMRSAGLAWQADLNDAYAHLHRGDGAGAAACLRRALPSARGKGAVVWDISMPIRIAARLAEAALEWEIEVDYVREVIRKRGLPPQSPDARAWPWPVRIYSLGGFRVESEAAKGATRRKAAHQPLVLLKTLIALGARDVEASAAAKHLWPGASAGDAENSLKTTLHRLRRYLGRDDAIIVQDNKLSLNGAVCWWDTHAFERLAADGAALQGNGCPGEELERLAQRAFSLYGGAFLGSENIPRAAARRERLRQQFYRLVCQVGDHYEKAARWSEAEAIYRRALEPEPLSEQFFQRLIVCLKRQNRDADALDVYHRCRDVLVSELGTRPSAETRALLDSAEGI